MSPYIKGEGYIPLDTVDNPCILCGKPGCEREVYFIEEDADIMHLVNLCGPHYGPYMRHGIRRLRAAVLAKEAIKS